VIDSKRSRQEFGCARRLFGKLCATCYTVEFLAFSNVAREDTEDSR